MSAVNGPDGAGQIEALFGVRHGEYARFAWSFVLFFCILSSYYILRPIREMLAVGSGPQNIPLLFTGTLVATLIATSVFGWIASRHPRRRFLPWVYLFFVVNILAFWFVFSIAVEGGRSHVWLGRGFFVWLSVFNLFVVSVFWSFMADIYTREQGRRMFGVISSGGSIGAFLGSIVTQRYVALIGFEQMLLVSAGLLLLAIFCLGRLQVWADASVGKSAPAGAAVSGLGGNALSGIAHVFSSRYFIGIAAASVIASLLGTALYMFAAQLVSEQISSPNAQTEFFAMINSWTTGLAFVFQALAVKQVVQRYGLDRSLAILPIASIIGFGLLFFVPTLFVVAAVTALRRAIGFGFAKPSTDMLYSVVSTEDKYKAKNFIDTTVYRAGDSASTWAIAPILALGVATLSAIMVPFAIAWTALVVWLGREYRRRARHLRDQGLK